MSKEELIAKARKTFRKKSKTQLINIIINLSFQLDKAKGDKKFWEFWK